MLLRLSLLLFLVRLSTSSEFDDVQTEFFLPYSETEDVDFSIVRPGGMGCYMWSVLIHSADPQSRLVLIIVFTHDVRPSVPTNQDFAKQVQ